MKWSNGDSPGAASGSKSPRSYRAAYANPTDDESPWQPPDLTGLTIVVQPHCHHHSVMGFDTDRQLLEGLGATLTVISGCCGLAGNFGMEKGHYEMSVAVAENALLPALRACSADTVVLADGFSCRTQIDQLAGIASTTLAQLLADHLTCPRGDL